ncbi:MAG: GGDEF domain-containing protein [Lachnospiraceae bacterium]|nr:GGDEF domain-containing protein [Lachnospiraceae bacterium]
MNTLKDLTPEQREDFFQSKYSYFKEFNKQLVIVATIAYLSFFFTDCGLFGRFSHETVLSRVIVIVPMIIFIALYKRITNYKIMVFATYLMIHIIIWCTDWATYLLTDRTYATTGMVIMNLIFVCAGFAAPFMWSTIAHAFLLVDITIAHQFIHYEDVAMMYMFNLPCIVAVCAMHKMMQRVYLDQYLTKESMQNLLVHDQLTGVYNRNKLKELAEVSTGKLCFARDIPVSLLVVDIDHFKEVNDTYGHESGDIVLTHIAKSIKGMLRASDYVIRWGGEEFLVIVPGCSLNEAEKMAERIRKLIEDSDNTICPLTVSIGVAPYTGGNYHDDIKRADEALYEAKGTGRNKVVAYKEEISE